MPDYEKKNAPKAAGGGQHADRQGYDDLERQGMGGDAARSEFDNLMKQAVPILTQLLAAQDQRRTPLQEAARPAVEIFRGISAALNLTSANERGKVSPVRQEASDVR